ncbi:PREDICTED: WD repeat-containing protein 18 [Bactrocera latifrons]|uniref:WD repeat-containing protein 18 n=1 Tax=Bactrocera latifrons TaxID=174628 RepID=A0A0K8WE85_BACLA|nr:PREDICTED: WD repeat-containing protein 18 [Bactrocera latifrons]
MAELVEVLFTSDSNESQASITAWDYRTGTNLMVYKSGGVIQPRAISLLDRHYILAANSTKPLLHVWPINSQQQVTSVRFVLPGRANSMALSPDMLYLVAAIQENIYIWHLPSGKMLNTISKHFQPINCIRFDEDSHFASAGQDGSVMLWNLTTVCARDDDSQTPVYTFTDHGLPVTDVHIGFGGIRAHMITVSLDRTCKIYDLLIGALLLNVVFAESLHSVITNTMETDVYVGTGDGNIYQFNTDAAAGNKELHVEKEHSNLFKGHKEGTAVTCFALSFDGKTLVSGGQDEQVCIWDVASKQLIKRMQHKGPVTNVKLRLSNPDIFKPENKPPKKFSGNLRRMLDAPEADEEECIEVLITEENADTDYEYWDTLEYPTEYLEEPSTSRATTNTTPTATATDEEAAKEIERLRAEVQHLKLVNKQLFEVSAKQLLETKK